MTIDTFVSQTYRQMGISPADTQSLSSSTLGPVLLPGQPGYDEERSGFDLSVRHQPSVIVGASCSADVKAAVAFAARRGLPVAVQATGHGATFPADGGILISTRRMKGVRVDPTERTAWFEAGVTWEQVIHKAAPYGLAPLNGSAPFVGAVSYTLGGGLGVLGRKYGYAADHVRQLDVVLADGRSIQVDAERQPDLFWGLRGDKGNLGVVTSMEIDLMPVARIYGGGLYFSADATSDVLHAYARWTETVPEEMASSVALGTFPDIGNMPEPLRGRFVTHVRLAYLGTAAAADRIIRPLRQAARPLMDTVQDIPYTLMGSIHNDPQDPLPVVNSTMMLRELEHHTVETLLALAGPAANAPFGVEIRHLGGALARPPKIPNAVGCRDAAFSLYAGSILDPDYAEVIRDSQQALVDRLRPWATGAEVLNFIHGANTTVERVRAAYRPADYDRLAALKAVYDPHNTFRFNHNIPPAARQASRQVEIG